MVTVSLTTAGAPAMMTSAGSHTTNGVPKSPGVPLTLSGSSKTKSHKSNPNKIIPCKDREFDVNTHCGVFCSETGKQCTRSLTCKSHALSLRRAVGGRRKPFDDLLEEHRANKEEMQRAKCLAAGKPYIPTPTQERRINKKANKIHPPAPPLQLHQHAHVKLAPHTDASPTAMPTKLPKPALPLPPRTVPPPVVPKDEPLPEPCSRLSSDGEDDAEEERDKMPYPHLPYHPRPAAVNNFGSRLAGNGCYVFNRRHDLMRAAFMVAVERHLHPPPHKKLCVESKLPQGSQITTNSKDPYEFPEGQNAQFGWGHGKFKSKKKKVPTATLR